LTILDWIWRNTPNVDGKSPVQMLMSRRTRTLLPMSQQLLQPKVMEGVKADITARKQKAKFHYDKTAKDLPDLTIGQSIRLQSDIPKQPWRKATCLQKVGPRSYLVETENGQKYRRNRKFLRNTNEPEITSPPVHPDQDMAAESARETIESSRQSTMTVSTTPETTKTSGDAKSTSKISTPDATSRAVSTRTRRNILKPAKYQDFVMN
jgi:hypothetical protein